MAETGKIVHGWGNDSVTISFGVSMLSDRPEPKAVEVQASVTRDNPTPQATTDNSLEKSENTTTDGVPNEKFE
jgi:hypothetical protein